MKLVAMMVVRNELDRYLRPCVEHLLEFCDEIRVLDDHSDDGSFEWLNGIVGVHVMRTDHPSFYEHEGHTRQLLLEWTMTSVPTHILAIDADEFVCEGPAVRTRVEDIGHGVASLTMQEVWKADEELLYIRQDGGWREHGVAVIFGVPETTVSDRSIRRHWRINDRALACGRIPVWSQVRANRGPNPSIGDILHMGWANEADRDARYQRYVVHDGGKHHAGSHLESIMWGDERVRITPRIWPQLDQKAEILERTQRT